MLHPVLASLLSTFCAVHTGKLDSKFKAVLVNSTKWQYYGTPQVGGPLQMTWNTSLVRAPRVNIELWGYRETGEDAAGSTTFNSKCWGRTHYLYVYYLSTFSGTALYTSNYFFGQQGERHSFKSESSPCPLVRASQHPNLLVFFSHFTANSS